MKNAQAVNTTYKEEISQLDFYATIREDDTPHITLLTSLHKYGEDKLLWGEYSAGMSKINQQIRTKVGFISLVNESEIVFGKADYQESKNQGEELELLNTIPQFRYNNVYGYSPVHILAVKELSEESLAVKELKVTEIKMKEIAESAGSGGDAKAFSVVTRQLLTAEEGARVLAFIDVDGYPRVVPVPHAIAASDNRIVFGLSPYEMYLNHLKDGMEIAIHAVSYKEMCAVLINGKVKIAEIDGEKVGILDAETVYSPMLPVFGFIYPVERAKPKAVKEFKNTLYEYNV